MIDDDYITGSCRQMASGDTKAFTNVFSYFRKPERDWMSNSQAVERVQSEFPAFLLPP
ncbi:MAG: hypothetical protein ABL921_32215 [Pirellula sp.]